MVIAYIVVLHLWRRETNLMFYLPAVQLIVDLHKEIWSGTPLGWRLISFRVIQCHRRVPYLSLLFPHSKVSWQVTCSSLLSARAVLWVVVPTIVPILSINQISIATIFPASKRGLVARHLNQCSTAKSKKQFHNINGPSGVLVSMGERPSQIDVSSDVSWR